MILNEAGGQGSRAPPLRARYYYMDSLRATLIIGGVLFHAALPYRASGAWNVREMGGNAVFDYLSEALYSFRMPTFFFVAGFFCALTFAARRAAANLRRRLIVFGLPLLSFVILVQPLQFGLRWLREHAAVDGGVGSPAFWSAYFSTGAYISHLWFLLNLIVYYVVVELALTVLARRGRVRQLAASWIRALPVWILRSKTILAVLCTLIVFPVYDLVVRVAPQVPGFGLEDLVLYLPFFVAGFLCFHSESALDSLGEVRIEDIILLVAGVALLMSGYVTQREMHDILRGWIFYQAAWTVGMLLVAAFRHWLDLENPAVRAVSDASYTIYLFHHSIVIVIATLLLGVAIPGGYASKYVLVVVVTTLLTFSLHHFLIRRSRILSWAFNGRAPPKPYRPEGVTPRVPG
ncbi:MAG: acyltransferase family protein [Steroidobacteraceae bacterium]